MLLTLNRTTWYRFAGLFFGMFFLSIALGAYILSRPRTLTPDVPAEECIPTFRDGGGPYYLPDAPFTEKLVPDQNDGQKLIVEGYIFDSDCSTPLGGAVLDVWQANETGEYEDDYYRGQVRTDGNGYYYFETVVPQGYGEGTGYRPPHLHFKVWLNNSELVTSQMFFDDVRGRQGFNDEYIMQITERGGVVYASHNIVIPDVQL